MENKTVSRIAIAFLCVVGLALLVLIGFIVIVIIACGQYKPPVPDNDYAMKSLQLTQQAPEACATLPTTLPVGSWWTDGAICYRAKRAGKTVRLEGWSLHEGGMVSSMYIVSDTLLQVVGEETTFAQDGSLVTRHSIVCEDGHPVELLVAWKDSTLTEPFAALERFNGDLDTYAEQAYHYALAGCYVSDEDSTQVWTFTTDGRIREGRDVQPVPYKIERIYHATTDVISFPYTNPKHISFMLTKQGLAICGVRYDEEEEYWETDYEVKGAMNRVEAPSWLGKQLFCLPMAVLMVDDYAQELMDEAFQSEDLFTQLNAYLMHYYLY